MKSIVAPSETNSSVLKFDGNALPSPMIPSSTDYGYFFSCGSIEQIILYFSVFVFLIYISNTVPCNFIQMYTLYQVPHVI